MIKREILKATNQVKLTFIQPTNGVQTRVSVVGDFNNWNPKANPLIKRSNNTASASVILPVGQCVRFRYVTGQGVWFNDEKADAYELSEHGEDNCLVII
ncbi:MAG: isoamylase early set domain-containing protein [Chloroflexi bacterium]|nr:isoamylase early set domain-containing protein [Chloroflexota bacterium]